MRSLRLLAVLSCALAVLSCGDKSPANTSGGGAPAIGQVTPPRGPLAGGTVGVIRGLNFTNDATVSFGATAATSVKVVDPTTIVFVSPAGGSAGTVQVVVSEKGGTSTLAGGFTYYSPDGTTLPAPVVSMIQPNGGPAAGGTYAVVSGMNFQDGALFIVGRRPGSEVVVGAATQLTGRTPFGDVGPADVEVTNPDGQTGKLAMAFAYNDAQGADPAITAVSPIAGPTAGGTVVTVSGSNFRQPLLIIGGRLATAGTFAATAVTGTTPASPPGVADVVVTNMDGRSAVSRGAYNFYVGGPVITKITPNFGPPDGGTDIVIEGRNLENQVIASIGGKAVNALQRIDDRTLHGISPSGPPGPADVTVLNLDGQSDSLPNGWAWGNAPPPTFALVRATPQIGPITGGTRITLIGSGFVAGATVTVGGTMATGVQVLGGSTLSASTPSGAVGPAEIAVTQNGTTARLALGFWYFDPSQSGAAPTLTAISPALGPSTGGTTALLVGSGFASGAKVFFGDSAATGVTVVDATSLSAVTPMGNLGPVDVRVQNPDGQIATLVQAFVYVDPSTLGAAPIVTSVTPNSGGSVDPTTVDIAAQNVQMGAVIFVGGLPASAVVVKTGGAGASFPPNAPGSDDVVITNPDGQSGKLVNGFTYTRSPPTLVSATPSTVPLSGGLKILLAGKGFVQGCGVSVDTTQVVPTFVDSTLLFVTAPAHTAGMVDVTVTNPDNQKSTLTGGLTYAAITLGNPPTLTSIFPPTGPTTGGTVALIVGTNFVDGAQILFAGTRATKVTVMSDTRLSAIAPPGIAGDTDVTLINPDGQSAQLVRGFKYVDPAMLGPGPQLFSVTPNSGVAVGGTQTVLTGMGFKSGALVFFGGYTANASAVQNAGIATATTPAGPKGSVDVAFTNPDGQSYVLPAGYSYVPRPELNTIFPSAGPTGGGTMFTLAGKNFVMGAKVFFDTIEATNLNIASATVITGTTPSHGAGPVDVKVVNPDGQSGILSAGFTFSAPPTIASVKPGAGPMAGGTTVTLSGTGFAAGATVLIGGGMATNVRVLSPSQLLAVTPSGVAGAADVKVTNADNQLVTLTRGFLYEPAELTVGRSTTYADIVVPAARDDNSYKTDLGVVNLSGKPLNVTLASLDNAGAQLAARALSSPVPAFGRVLVPDALQFIASSGGLTNKTASIVVSADGPAQAFGVLVDKTSNDASMVPGNTAARASAKVFVPYASSVGAFKTWLTVRNVGAAAAVVDIIARDPSGAQLGKLNAVNIPSGGFYSNDDVLGAMSVTGATATLEINGTAVSVLAAARTYSNARLGALVSGKPSSDASLTQTVAWLPDTSNETSSLYLFNTDSGGAAAVTMDLRNPAGQSYGTQNVSVPASGFVQVPDLARSILMRTGATQTLSSVFISSSRPMLAFAFVLNIANADLRFAHARPGGGVRMTFPYSDPRTSLFVTNVGLLPSTVEISITADNGSLRGNVLRIVIPPRGTFQAPAILSSLGAGTSAGWLDVRGTNGVPIVASVKLGIDPAGLLGDANELDDVITTPAIDQIRPATGPSTGGTMSRVTGQYLLPFAQFLYGSALAPRSSVYADDTAVVVSPPGTGNVDLTVVNFDGASATLVNAFAYVDPGALTQPPAIATVTPQTVSTLGGTPVQINGSNFASNALAFVGLSPVAGATQVNPTRIDGAAPVGSVGPADVTVTNPDGQSATLTSAVTYAVPPPSVSTVTPPSGPGKGGTVVRLNGNGFQPNANVSFGTTAATIVTVLSNTDIDVTTPPGVDGPAAVTVTNPDGQTTTVNNGFTYIAAPTVVQVQPTSGPTSGGTTITLTGTFFRTGATVKVGTTACTNIVIQPGGTVITCLTPVGTAGPAAVTVTNPDGQFGLLNNAFTYLAPVPPPTVTAVSPAFGPTTGGTQVTVVGTGFQAGATVKFGATSAVAVNVISPSALSATAPGTASVGAVTITVTNPDTQFGALPNSFTYFQPASLPGIAVVSVTPNTGPAAGGNQVFVSGQGFMAGVTVNFGGTPSPSVSYLGPSALGVTVPAHALGNVNVQAINPNSQQSTLTNGYNYANTVLFNPPPMRLPMVTERGYGFNLLFDADNDGDLDVFMARRQLGCDDDGSDQIWLNDGTGQFTIAGPTVLPPINRPTIFAVSADFDNNGTKDLFTITNAMTTPASFYKNTVGTFARFDTPTMNTLQGEQRALALGDLNLDGKPDIYVGVNNQSGNALDYYYLNNGDGGFTPTRAGLPAIVDDTRAVCIADYDNDGDDDIFIVNGSNQQATYFLQGPAGVFTNSSALLPTGGLGGNGTGCVQGEFRPGSGIKDIVMTREQNGLAGTYVYLKNNGLGRFTDESQVNIFHLPPAPPSQNVGWPYPVGSGGHYGGIVSVDFDNDGDLDLLINHYDLSPRVQVYINDGTGFFTLGTAGRSPPYLDAESYFAVGDVNSDGRSDVLISGDNLNWGYANNNNAPAQSRLLLNSPTGLQYATMKTLPEQSFCASDAVNFDIDNDGDQDMIIATGCRLMNDLRCCGGTEPASCRANGVRVWINDGAGGYVDQTSTRFPAFNWSAISLAVGDIDKDGKLDLVVGTSAVNPTNGTVQDQYGIRLYKNNGAGIFTDITNPRMPLNTLAAHVLTLIDIDKDGALDLYAAEDEVCCGQGRQFLYINTGTGFFIDVTNQLPYATFPGSMRPKAATVADFNNDGYADLYVASVASQPGRMFFNSGLPTPGFFTDVTAAQVPNVARASFAVVSGDLDLDTFQDLVICNGGGGIGGNDQIDLGSVTGRLSEVTQSNWPGENQPFPYQSICSGTMTPQNSYSCDVGDVDGDGDLDIVLAGADQSSMFMRNRLMVNVGLANFQDSTLASMPYDNDYTTKVKLYRANADAKLDLFVGTCGQPRLYLNQ